MINKTWNLYNEDCAEGMKHLEDESVDLVVTSPPYDSLRTYNGFSFDFESPETVINLSFPHSQYVGL